MTDTNQLTIHEVEGKHLDDLAKLFNEYRIFYKQADNMSKAYQFLEERIAKSDSRIFIAYRDSIPVGFTQLYPTFSSVSLQSFFILNDLYVTASSRGLGIGEALLNRAKELAISSGSKGLALETAIDNPAQKLYERLDWMKDESFLHYFWTAK